MARISKKPFITLECNFEKPFTLFDDGKPRHLHRNTYIEFPTYRDFLRKLKQVSVGSGYWTIRLTRYKKRGGRWEWFEYWRNDNGKLSIVNQGWM